jgi:Na+-transporting methylmalonyl-CoA/oxaloacetate decarboxylase gamma subunit
VTFFKNTNYFSFDSNAVFFLGMGLTFLLLFLIPTRIGRLKWTLYAAIPLLLVGAFLIYKGDSQLWQYAGPALVILAGLYFIVGSLVRRMLPKKSKPEKTEPEIEIIPPQF